MGRAFRRWVSKVQRGFIGGRSRLANVVDIDAAMRTFALKHPSAAFIFSISRQRSPRWTRALSWTC
eukprot:1270361-Pyramimonas_sp.AAC.1